MSKPSPASRRFTIRGTKPATAERKRHLKLVPRDTNVHNLERFEWTCIRCGGPREQRSFPVCPDCQTGNAA